MINREQAHLHVLPEDDADRQLANGFKTHPAVDQNRIQVLPPAKGWLRVLEAVKKNHEGQLRSFPDRRLVLLIDFDGDADGRLKSARTDHIPQDLQERVFILGAHGDPEDVKRTLKIGPLEKIGWALAQDCYSGTPEYWSHPKLAHNASELERLNRAVRPWLFS
jgi:hypothetical protein